MEKSLIQELVLGESVVFRKNYSRSFQRGTLRRMTSLGCVMEENSLQPLRVGEKIYVLFEWGDFKRFIQASVKEILENQNFKLDFDLPLQKDRRTIDIYIEFIKNQTTKQKEDLKSLLQTVF